MVLQWMQVEWRVPLRGSGETQTLAVVIRFVCIFCTHRWWWPEPKPPENFLYLIFYRLQEKVLFSHVSVILSTIGLIATRSLPILITARSVRILLECFLVYFVLLSYCYPFQICFYLCLLSAHCFYLPVLVVSFSFLLFVSYFFIVFVSFVFFREGNWFLEIYLFCFCHFCFTFFPFYP